MSLPNSYYVNILASAGGAATVATRQPIGRWFTTNQLCPFGTVQEFESLDTVGDYFGTTSEEYQRAQSYFGFVSKNRRSPKLISYARYTPTGTPVGASIMSGNATKTSPSFTLATFTAISDGTLTINYVDPVSGLQSGTASNINLSSASELNDVAETLQTAIRAIQVDSTSPFATATVEYSTSLNGSRFILTLPSGYGSFNACGGTLASDLGWDSFAILSNGNNGEDSIAEQVDAVMNENDNCYTFAFIETLAQADIEAVAEWNENENAVFMYVVPFNSISSIGTNIGNLNYDHLWVQYDNTNEHQEFMPMAALACRDFTKPSIGFNFMFQTFPDNSYVVKDLNTATALDAMNVNYYAEVQSAGVKSGWLQRGKCQGQFADATVAVDAIWIKSEVIRKVRELFALNNAVPANSTGQALIKACLTSVWSQGVNNGCILKEKALSESELAFIVAQTNDENAWVQIYQTGIWFSCSIETSTSQSTLGEKYFSFTLLYAAADQIRKVEGNQIAITSAQ